MIDIDRMVAGREMDRLVGRHVMGWEEADYPSDGSVRVWRPEGYWVLEYLDEVEVWNPSISIDCAMDVVAQMRTTKNNWFSLNWYGDNEDWYAGFGDGSRSFSSQGSTAPLAICRAAINAMSMCR